MNRCAIQRTQSLLRAGISTLCLLTLCGCAAFENIGSLSGLLNSSVADAEAVTAATEESEYSDIERAEPLIEPVAATGRLQAPEFGIAPVDDAESSGGHSMAPETVVAPDQERSVKATTASQTRELFEPSQGGEVLSEARSVEEMEQTVDSMSYSRPNIQTAGNGRSVTQVSAAAIPPEVPQEVSEPLPPAERSVLERLRGLAPDRNTGDRWLRQFERLPNPLNLLPGRDTEEAPPQSVEIIPQVTPVPTPEQAIASAADSEELLQALIERMEQELNSWPETESGSALQPEEFRRRQLNLRLLRLIADEPAAAAEAISAATAEEQEFWQDLILALSRFRSPDNAVDYDEHIAATIGQLRKAVRQLEPLSRLAIPRMAFCSGIDSFGSIVPFPSNTFKPGQRLLIYAEVDNLQSEVSPLGDYRTSFSGVVQVWADESEAPEEPIKTEPFEPHHDDSSTRRSDYFVAYEFNLPAHLSPGAYELRLLLRDEISGRSVTESLRFTVH